MFKRFLSALAGVVVALATTTSFAMPVNPQRNNLLAYSIQIQHLIIEQKASLSGAVKFFGQGESRFLPVGYRHGSAPLSPPAGISQVMLSVGADLTPITYTNALRGNQATNNNTSIDVDGSQYPITTLTQQIGSQTNGLWLNSTYTLSCAATRPFMSIVFGNTTTPTFVVSSFTGGMTLSGSGTPGTFTSSNQNFKCNGSTAGTAVFQCTSQCFGLSILYPTGYAFAPGSGEWILCRSTNNGGAPNDDCSQYALAMSTSGASGSFFVPEFVAAIKGAGFGWLRNMGSSASDTTKMTTFGYRAQITDLHLTFTSRNVPSARSGGAGNTTPTCPLTAGSSGQAPYIFTCAPSDDMNNSANDQSLGAWADGDTVMGNPGTGPTPGWTLVNAVGDSTTNCGGGPCVSASIAHSQMTTASISGTTMTVSAFNSYGGGSASVLLGDTVFSISGTSVAANTTIVGNSTTNSSACAPACTGAGGTGTYAVSVSQTVAAQALYAGNVSAAIVGNVLYVNGLTSGTTEAGGVQTITNISSDGYHVTFNTAFVHACSGCLGYISPFAIVVSTKAGGAQAFILNCEGQGYNDNCGGINSNQLGTGYSTFAYDAILGGVIEQGGGVSPGMAPYEYFINLANQTDANFWLNLPITATNTYKTRTASLILSLMKAPLKVLTEDGNEVWNPAYQPWRLAIQRENWLNITNGSPLDYTHYMAVLASDTALAFSSVFSGSNRSRYEAAMMGQFCCALSSSDYILALGGSLLSTATNAPLCVHFGGTFTSGCSVAGRNVYPNRPIDDINTIGGAPYVGGNNITNGSDVGGSGFGLASAWFFQPVVNDWINGSEAAAISLIDQDLRGTYPRRAPQALTCSGTTFTTGTGASSYEPGGNGNFFLFTSPGGTLPSGLAGNQVYTTDTITGTASFTGTGSGTNLTVTGVTGTIAIGAAVAGTGVPSTITTTIVSQTSGTTGGAGLYVTSAATTSAGAALTTSPWNFTMKGFTAGIQNGSDVNCGTPGTGTLSLNSLIYTSTPFTFTQGNNSTVQTNLQLWQTLACSYSSSTQQSCGTAANPRPSGMGPVLMRWYEGDIEVNPYAAATFAAAVPPIQIGTTVGITGSTHTNTVVDSLSTALGYYTGMTVAAGDISGLTVSSINSGCPTTCTGNYVILSGNATGTNAGEGITFSDPSSTGAANAFNDAVFTGYKNDPSFAVTWEYYYKGFMGTDINQVTFGLMPNSGSPSSLNFLLSQQWGFSSCTSLFCNPLTSPFWQNYNGTSSFNSGH